MRLDSDFLIIFSPFLVIKNILFVLSLLDDIIMLELSTISKIPSHLQRILSERNFSPIDILNALIYYVAIESSFLSDRVDGSSYIYTWYYSFDKRVFEDIQCDHFARKMGLKFVMNQSCEFTLELIELGDIALVTIYENSNSKVTHCESVAIPISRYIPFKKLLNPISSSFRNLKELTHKLKHELFHPLRNEIYQRSRNVSPWLNGLPEEILISIYKYLDVKSKKNLSQTCKAHYVNLLHFKKLRR